MSQKKNIAIIGAGGLVATMYQWTAETILKNPTVVWVRKVKPSSWRVFLTALKIWIFSYENSNREVAPTYSVRD